jgi:hypothetical protein
MDREMGRSGAASDMVTGDQAEAEAFLQCQKLKTAKCKVDIVYANACVAMAWPVEGGFVINRVGKDLDSAVSDAMKQCTAKNGGACIIKYTDCSMPSFDRF